MRITRRTSTRTASPASNASRVSNADPVPRWPTGASDVRSQLIWFDRTGKQIAVLGEQADHSDVELSPDGTRAAVAVLDPARASRDLWIYDVARGLRTRFTFDPGDEAFPVWSPDGSRIGFAATGRGLAAGGQYSLSVKASSGAGDAELLLTEALSLVPTRVFSPDGRWIAYQSHESGRNEVYVAPFPGPGGKWQISTAGGTFPRWRRDATELYYPAADNRLMAAQVNGGGAGFQFGTVGALFGTRPRLGGFAPGVPHDVSADGQRVLVNTLVQEATSEPITLVVNWPALLQ